MSQPNVVPRMNRRVLLGEERVDEEADEASAISAPGAYLLFASSATSAEAAADDEALFAETDPARLASAIAARTKYLSKKGKKRNPIVLLRVFLLNHQLDATRAPLNNTFLVSPSGSPAGVLDENDVFEITEWVVGDFDTREGQELIVNALKHLVRIPPHSRAASNTHTQSLSCGCSHRKPLVPCESRSSTIRRWSHRRAPTREPRVCRPRC